MGDYLEGLDPANIPNVVRKLVGDVAFLMGRTLDVNELDEITTAMGVMLSGEFRCGNGEEPGEGFSGVRMLYPGAEYSGETYNIVGVLLDALQFGLRASDGAGVFAAGKGVIDSSGINLNGILYALRHYAEDPDGNNPRYGRLEMVYPDGKTIPALCLSFIDATVTEELMGSNRSFELDDFSQWTAGADWSVETEAGNLVAVFSGGFTSTLVSDRFAVTAGSNYKFALKYGATAISAQGPLTIEVKFYDAASAGSLLGTSTIFSSSFSSPVSITLTDKTVRAPLGALSVEFVVTADNFGTYPCFVDDFSIMAVPLVRCIRFDPDPVIVDDTSTRKILAANKELQVPRAPSAALVATASGNVTNGAHTYKVTCLDSEGETIPSLASNSVTVDGTHKQVTVTLPLGGTGTTSRNIYRTAAGGTAYLLLATVADNTTTSYTDNIADASLGAAAPGVNSTGTSALLPTKALVRWKSDVRSNHNGWTYNGTWTYSGSAIGPYAFIPVGSDSAGANNGDIFEFDVFLAPGTYKMLIHWQRMSSSGKLDFYENDALTPFAAGVDLYVGSTEKEVTDCVLTGAGLHHIRAVVNGKNASASDYTVIIADVEFIRTA